MKIADNIFLSIKLIILLIILEEYFHTHISYIAMEYHQKTQINTTVKI